MSVHEIAASGFGAEADAYERTRPSYPPDAVAWIVDALGVTPAGRVCDVAAGTGKFTRLLVGALPDVDVVAVEPVAGMRAFVAGSVPAVGATAEHLPFSAASLDGVTVAQAFHWFDAPVALGEFARVLRPGSRLALVWNQRGRSEGWVDRVWSVVDRLEDGPWNSRDDWGATAAAVDACAEFGPLHRATFHHAQQLTHDEAVDRVRSVSLVAALPADRQQAVLDEVRQILQDDPATAGHEHVSLPYRVDAFWTERS